jgi:alpha-glucoside transport system substrate-binding protein
MKLVKTAAVAAAFAMIAGSPAIAATTAKKTTSLLNGKIACKNQYKGKKVTIFSPNDTVGDIKNFGAAWAPFEKCTGVKITWEGTKTFEADVKLRLAGGNAPGIIDFPQPGLLAAQAKAGKLIELPADIKTDISNNLLGGWLDYSSVGGKVYGYPFRQNFKSFVWYSPKAFAAKGYKVPTSLDEMKTLSDKIVTDGGTPWCAGIESGAATGWVITDWVEDMMLRTTTPANYDKWVDHTLKFNTPEVKTAFDAVGSYLKNEKYVGNVKAIATTKFQDGGLPILDGKCYMHRQANFYKSNWPAGTTFGDTGTVNAFYLPMAKASDPKAMLGGGDINAATNKKPETIDTMRYLASVDWANATAANMGNFSPRKDYDTSLLPDKFDQVFANIGKNAATFRFDASDLMPGAVGAGSFWKEATSWITGQSTDDTLANIDKSWPAS